MTVYETTHFRVFRMKINGRFYFFVARNVEQSGFIFTYTDIMSAITQCNMMQSSVENGTLIL